MQPAQVTAPVVPWLLGACAVAAATHGYLWLRLLRGRASRALGTGLLIALGALLPTGMAGLLYMRALPRPLAQPLMTVSFTWLGTLFFLLLALLLFDGLALLWPAVARWRARASVGLAALLSACAIGQALRGPALATHRVYAPGLPDALSGYRVVQLSDLHVGPTLGRDFVEAIVAQTNAARPDLIALTGDVVDGPVAELAPLLAPLRGLRARDGVYLVLGNHEYLSGADAWAEVFIQLGIRVLRNECVALRGFDLIGLDDAVEGPAGAPAADLARAFSSHGEGRFAIVLSHEPATVIGTSARGVGLQLSGHTHGGQVFPLHLLAWLDQRYLSGLYAVGATQLHVSPGAGYWGPPMRLGSRGEISLLVLDRTR
jgi:predicted MPP superfamily phosphohydrolase